MYVFPIDCILPLSDPGCTSVLTAKPVESGVCYKRPEASTYIFLTSCPLQIKQPLLSRIVSSAASHPIQSSAHPVNGSSE